MSSIDSIGRNSSRNRNTLGRTANWVGLVTSWVMLEMREVGTSARQIFGRLEPVGYVELGVGRFAGSSKHDSLAIALGLKGAYCDLDWHRDWG